MNAPGFDDVVTAAERIAPYLPPTPLREYASLGRPVGARAWGKHENLQPTCAFKVRGGINLVSQLSPADREAGVISASTGNHGQSIAYAARFFGVRATICVPRGANAVKLEAMEDLGAELVVHGRDFDEAREHGEGRAAREGLRYVHSANEPLLIAGVGTYALELLEAVPDLDAIFVPVGAGSGVLGTATVARAVNPAIRIIGVQAEGAPAVYRSWKEGRRVETDTIETFAEGLATRQPFELPLQLLPRLVDEIMLVGDDEMTAAILLLLETARQVVEGAGAAAVAAAAKRRDELAGKKIGLVLSGGNITLDQLRRILGGEPAKAGVA